MRDIRFRQALLARRALLPADRSSSSLAAGPRLGSAISRRQFVQGTGAAVAAAAFAGAMRPATVLAAGNDPVPITGSPGLSPFSVWAPLFVDSIDADPASITNFNGIAGLAYVNGTVHRRNTVTEEVDTFPFLDADMRFMQGVYRGVDGRPRQGTFGFV
jgi:hypothetical protein